MWLHRFSNGRSSLRFHPLCNHDVAPADPLGHSRIMMENFSVNSASMAVPTGVFYFDENTIRCKGSTRDSKYMKSKLVRFGIRLYKTVGRGARYLHSAADNRSGDKRGVSPPAKYFSLFQSLRTVHTRTSDDKLVPKEQSLLRMGTADLSSSCFSAKFSWKVGSYRQFLQSKRTCRTCAPNDRR